MKNRRRRQPQQREKPGKTKAYIVLCLLDGEKDRTEISEYMKTHHNIINRSNIKNHLSGLAKTEIVEPGDIIPGKPRPYRIKPGFEPLKKILELLKSSDLENELLDKAYFKNYIASEDFRIKFIANVFRANIERIDDIIHDEEHYKLLITRLSETPGTKKLVDLINEIRDCDIGNDFVTQYQTIINDIKNSTVDNYLPILTDRFQKEGAFIEPSLFLTYMGNYVMPTTERHSMLKNLTSSPSAVKFTLNPTHYDKYIFWNLLAAYTGSTILSEPRHFEETMGTIWEKDKNSTTFVKILDFIYNNIELYEKSDESPLTTILKLWMLTDILNGDPLKAEIIPAKIRIDFSQTNDLQEKTNKSPTNNTDLPTKNPTSNKKSSTKKGGVKE